MTSDPARKLRAEPPVLETRRLLLTGHTADMFEPLFAMWSDPDVVKHISGKPSTARESWMRMLSYRGLWPILGYGYWAICEKQTGRYVGDLGFADFHRDIEPSIRGVPEAGWVLSTDAHGKGFATEALTAALAWLEREVRCERSVCLISRENRASIRVAEKAGYRHSMSTYANGQETLVFARVGTRTP